ncbi:hypothetical protein C5L29_002857 [Lactiplantibacillus pentosus]|nr:hypothetical protein C5L29_002857 [Lactiplantibacillus pentosus]GEO50686.1 hypothetical protein LPE01_20470 [Lactiplantibacillus pentosus]
MNTSEIVHPRSLPFIDLCKLTKCNNFSKGAVFMNETVKKQKRLQVNVSPELAEQSQNIF